MRLDELREAKHNPRRGNVPAIKESLTENGQFLPIIVRKETGEILAGNHTYRAAKELGWETIQVVFADVDAETGQRILLADNRTADLAVNDDEALSKLLQELETLEGTGYNLDDVQELRRVTGELADEAMAALDAALGDPVDYDPPDNEEQPFEAMLSFTVSVEQRVEIMTALRHVVVERELDNSNQALLEFLGIEA